MKLFKLALISMALICGSASNAVSANDSAPLVQVKSTINHILDTLRNDALSRVEKRETIKEKISHSFDFSGMSQRTLATNWKKASTQQQQAFTELFRQLIQSTYIGRIEAYTDEKVDYQDDKIKGEKAIVKTLIITKSTEIPIVYKLIQKDNHWLVYDVEIEKVSLISNYRSTYQDIISKDGIDNLLSSMRNKVEELNQAL